MKTRVFLWIAVLCAVVATSEAAANPEGKWKGSLGRGGIEVIFNFKVDGEKVTGTMTDTHGESPISDGQFKNGEVSFVIVYNLDGHELRVRYQGAISDNEAKFVYSWDEGVNREFTVTRIPQ